MGEVGILFSRWGGLEGGDEQEAAEDGVAEQGDPTDSSCAGVGSHEACPPYEGQAGSAVLIDTGREGRFVAAWSLGQLRGQVGDLRFQFGDATACCLMTCRPARFVSGIMGRYHIRQSHDRTGHTNHRGFAARFVENVLSRTGLRSAGQGILYSSIFRLSGSLSG